MATRINTAQRNMLADSGIDFGGGVAEVRSGAQPASANDVASGVLLASITLPTPALTAAVDGVRSKSGVWSAVAAATGTAGYVRLISATGDRRMDLAVGIEVTFTPDANITSGATVTVDTVSITVPAA